MKIADTAHDEGPSAFAPAAELELRKVSKRYPGQREPAIGELSLTVPAGEVCVLVGPSGSGKTTAMRLINRMIPITSGDILLGGRSVLEREPRQLRREIGYVIQQVGLFPHQTVGANIGTVPKLLGWDRDRISARTTELLELVGLDPDRFASRYPSELSGGQRQRVGVARALAADPPVLLMDEPFGAVDPIARERLQGEFLRLQETVRKTIVFVTHDVDEAVKLGDRIAVMRDGSLEQYADPTTVLTHPASDFVADFVGAERSLRRLRVAAIDRGRLQPWPVIGSTEAVADHRAQVNGYGLVVADGVDVAGVITSDTLPSSSGTAGDAAARVAVVDLAEPLESALAAMLAAPAPDGAHPAATKNTVAVVRDGGGIAGVLTLQALLDSARGPESADETAAAD